MHVHCVHVMQTTKITVSNSSMNFDMANSQIQNDRVPFQREFVALQMTSERLVGGNSIVSKIRP